MAISKKTAVGLLLQTALVVGLLFLGWGFDDLAGYFAHPARTGLLVVFLLSLVWIFAAGLDLQVFRKSKRSVGRQPLGLMMAMLIALLLVWFLPYADRRGLLTLAEADSFRYVGLALYAGGNAVALVAVRTLGKQYSGYVTLQEEHRLVDTGIYGLIRHPIYLRALMASVGLPLLFRNWLVLPLFPLVAALVSRRIRQEEALLAGHFRGAYEAYRRRTWRLIPYLY